MVETLIDAAQQDQPGGTHASMRVVINELWQWHSGEFCPVETWQPAINVYQLEDRLEICVDLAGIDPRNLELHVERERLMIRGVRAAPDPRRSPQPMRIISMEINHGPFCRIIDLPAPVDGGRVSTNYHNGLLMIRIPLAAH